jgi:uncharacterized protein (DUF433 family)
MAAEQRRIEMDPCMRFGAPCVPGTRLDAELVANWIWNEGWEATQDAYDHLTRDGALVACWWVVRYGKKRWRKRWGAWYDSVPYVGGWWEADWSVIPLPPRGPKPA